MEKALTLLIGKCPLCEECYIESKLILKKNIPSINFTFHLPNAFQYTLQLLTFHRVNIIILLVLLKFLLFQLSLQPLVCEPRSAFPEVSFRKDGYNNNTDD